MSKRKKRIIVISVILVVIIALGVGGWFLWDRYGDQLRDSTTGTLEASGTVEAETVAVSALVASAIDEVLGIEGGDVASGTVLFKLDPTMLQLQVDQAAAGLKAARAALDQTKADGKPQTEIDQAQARVDQAQAALKMAEVQLSYAEVKAPVEGVLSQVNASIGEITAPGLRLATISNLDDLFVTIYISQERIGEVSTGTRASVTSDSSARTFEGTVVYVASEPEFTPANIETEEQRTKLVYEVRLSVDNIGSELKPGMPVNVEF